MGIESAHEEKPVVQEVEWVSKLRLNWMRGRRLCIRGWPKTKQNYNYISDLKPRFLSAFFTTVLCFFFVNFTIKQILFDDLSVFLTRNITQIKFMLSHQWKKLKIILDELELFEKLASNIWWSPIPVVSSFYRHCWWLIG